MDRRDVEIESIAYEMLAEDFIAEYDRHRANGENREDLLVGISQSLITVNIPRLTSMVAILVAMLAEERLALESSPV